MLSSAFTLDGLDEDGQVIHPRAWVELLTSFSSQDVPTGIVPSKMVHHVGSHSKADEASVTIDAAAFGFPIRQVAGCVYSLYYGLVENPGDSVKSSQSERFFGVVVDYDVDEAARAATLKAQDLSYLLRKKAYPVRKTLVTNSDGIVTNTIDPTPYYSDSLQKNCERMMSIIPEFSDPTVQPPLTFRQTDALKNANLAGLVSARARNSPITLHPDCTVWEGIEHICGLLGLHVRVELREIVVRTAPEVFEGRSSKAVFIFGGRTANCFGPKFHKKPVANRNGVRVIAFDPDQRKQVSAVYPSDDIQRKISKKQPRRTRPAPKAKTSKKPPLAPPDPPRDVYELDPGHYTHDALTAKAHDIWLQRSRQEADGTVSTPVWTEENLALRNGDLITVKVDHDVSQTIAKIGDDAAASQVLQETMGYQREMADAIVKASRKPSVDDWYCKEVTNEWPSETLQTVHFINLVEI
jgi:hypothetical protein